MPWSRGLLQAVTSIHMQILAEAEDEADEEDAGGST
jgi:hypothetical protein